jgi:hypothetical protein
MLLEYGLPLVYFLLAIFVISQMVVPSILGRHWFPAFRKTRVQLLDDLEEVKDVDEEKRIQSEIERISKGEKNGASQNIPVRETGNINNSTDSGPDISGKHVGTRGPESDHGNSVS